MQFEQLSPPVAISRRTNTPTLRLPHMKYRTSFFTALTEFQHEGERADLDSQELRQDFGVYLQKLRDTALGIGLGVGEVPATEYWIIIAGEYVGRLTLRHRLTAELERVGGHISYEIRPSKRGQGYATTALRLGLDEARMHGLHGLLITCEAQNLASIRVIEANGGELQDEINDTRTQVPVRRYWIALSSAA